MEQKYILTDETIEVNGVTLHRIKAVRDFSNVCKGELGGFIQMENNLSHKGDAWVYHNAMVFGKAMVCDDAVVYDNANVFGHAKVYGEATVCDNTSVYDKAEVYDKATVYGKAEVYGNADVYGHANIYGDAKVSSMADYIVFKNWWSSGRYFTWTRSNDRWRVGCFYGSGKELIAKAYEDSEISGREYQRVVEYIESIKNR